MMGMDRDVAWTNKLSDQILHVISLHILKV